MIIKRTWLDISKYLLSRYEDHPSDFIERVVTRDETWVHDFDPESKMQRKQWMYPGSSRCRTFKRVHSAGKVMTSILWDSQGVIIFDYLEQCNIIIDAYYAGKLWRLRQVIARKRQGKLTCGVMVKFSFPGSPKYKGPRTF